MNSDRRDASLDIARGIAAIAVVFGHCWRGLNSANLMPQVSAFDAVDRAVYMVHLSVFAMLSGILIPSSYERKKNSYLRVRCATFIWLYVLWTVLQGCTQFLASSSVNRPISLVDIVELWRPTGQFWFFPWIILMVVAAVILKPWRNMPRSIIGLVTAGIVSYSTWGWGTSYAFTQGLGLTLFFFLGCTLGSRRYFIIKRTMKLGITLSTLILGAVGYSLLLAFTPIMGPTMRPTDFSITTKLYSMLCSTLGVVGVIALSILVERLGLIRKGLAFVGQQALPVYVAQILGSSGTRIVLEKAGIVSVPVHAIIGTIMGVAFPLLLWRFTRKHLPWLWTLPTQWKARLTRGSEVHDSTATNEK